MARSRHFLSRLEHRSTTLLCLYALPAEPRGLDRQTRYRLWWLGTDLVVSEALSKRSLSLNR